MIPGGIEEMNRPSGMKMHGGRRRPDVLERTQYPRPQGIKPHSNCG